MLMSDSTVVKLKRRGTRPRGERTRRKILDATLGVIGVEGRFDYTAIGNSVNLAARLSDVAGDGQILMGRRIWAAIDGNVVSESAGTMEVKGLSQPVEVYLLKGLSEVKTQTER